MPQEIGYARVSKPEQHLACLVRCLEKRGVVILPDKAGQGQVEQDLTSCDIRYWLAVHGALHAEVLRKPIKVARSPLACFVLLKTVVL